MAGFRPSYRPLPMVLAALFCVPLPAYPSQAEPPASSERMPATAAGTLEEIVVTARRREESLLDTPVAITALSGDDLEALQVDSLSQLSSHVPNLTFQPGAPTGGGATTPSVFIRGVGSFETSMGTEPGVGLYVDDVYIARSIGSVLDLAAIESVQVLRGPQGTLFGRNSVGGAVVVRTMAPADEFGGTLRVATGSRDRLDLRGSVTGPLSDTVRVRLTGLASYRDGHVRNVDGGDDFGSTDRVAGRIVVNWTPAASLDISLRADGTRARESAVASVLLGLVPGIPGTNVPSMIQSLSNLQGTCFGASVLGNSGNPDCIDQQFILGPFHAHDGYVTDEPIFDSQGSKPFSNRSDLDTGGASLTADWSLNDGLQLRSITAYREMEAFWAADSDHSWNPGIENKNDLEQSQFSQELQLLGRSPSDAFNWIVGGYFLDEEGTALNVVAFPAVIFRSGGAYETRSTAVFAQGSYRPADRLELTLGARYTHEDKRYDTLDNQQVIGVLDDPFTRRFIDLRAAPVPFVFGSTPDLETDEVTPYASIGYRWSPDWMSYLSYSEGYKSGGYEQRLAPGTPEVPRFAPEYVKVVELGLKGEVLDGRMRLAGALFHSDYTDMQISVVDGVAPTLTNAGDATLRGGELEVQWMPLPALTLTSSLGYLDAGYDRVTPRALFSGVMPDNALPNAPEWQAALSLAYEISLGNGWTLTPQADASHRSELYLDGANSPLLRVGALNLFNASLTLAPESRRWELALSGRNLGDEAYLVAGIAQYNVGEIEGQHARPREWNLSARFNF